MPSVDVAKLDNLLAAYDWYLFLKETDNQTLQFRTVTTQWKDMGAYRDYCFISELFPVPIKWIQNKSVADTLLKMHRLTEAISRPGSSFPYCESTQIVSKSDLSKSEHASLHDYVHTIGAILGNPCSCNSRFVSASIARNDICLAAAMCIMATGAMKSEVRLNDDDSIEVKYATANALRLNNIESLAIPVNVLVWIENYKDAPSAIGNWFKYKLSIYDMLRSGSVLYYLNSTHMDWKIE